MAYIKKAIRQEIDCINEYLNTIGFPEHWNKFIDEEKTKDYLIIKNKNNCKCNYCHSEFETKKKVNDFEVCPGCNNKLLIKSDKLLGYRTIKNLCLIQKHNENYIFRVFELLTYFKEGTTNHSIVEWARIVKDNNFICHAVYFSQALHNNMGSLFVSHYGEKDNWRPYEYAINNTFRYYYYNFKELFEDNNKYCLIWDLAKNVEQLHFGEVAYSCFHRKSNFVEYATKVGLYNLANNCNEFDDSKSFKDAFGLDKSYLEFMIANNISNNELEILKEIKIKDIELIRYLAKFNYKKILKYCKPNDFYKYKLNQQNNFIYIDYLEFAIKLGYDISDKKILYPRHLKQMHDLYMNQIEINKNKDVQNKICKRYNKLKKYTYSNNKFIIYPAKNIESLIDESKQQNNCVKTYAERYSKGECDIYFMRLLDKQNISLVTVEVRNNKVFQKRTKNNSITTKDQDKFLREWEKNIVLANQCRSNVAVGLKT